MVAENSGIRISEEMQAMTEQAYKDLLSSFMRDTDGFSTALKVAVKLFESMDPSGEEEIKSQKYIVKALSWMGMKLCADGQEIDEASLNQN